MGGPHRTEVVMSSTQRSSRLVGAVLVALLAVSPGVAHASPAEAHARVIGTYPEDAAILDLPPWQVVIFLTAKPATIEGDPIRVYAPSGERVDAGEATILDDEATALSVGLAPDAVLPSGDYQVTYRMVSLDAHLVAGSFGFTSQQVGAPSAADTAVSPPAPASASHGLTSASPADPWHWPKALFAVGAPAALLGVSWQRRRTRRRPRPAGQFPPRSRMSGR
jgi:methionine-rich copper-binding protein CopC